MASCSSVFSKDAKCDKCLLFASTTWIWDPILFYTDHVIIVARTSYNKLNLSIGYMTMYTMYMFLSYGHFKIMGTPWYIPLIRGTYIFTMQVGVMNKEVERMLKAKILS